MLVSLAISAVLIARLVERRSHVFAVMHSIFFIILSVCLFFTSDSALIIQAGCNIFGKADYYAMREAIATPAMLLGFGYSACAIAEVGALLSLALATAHTVAFGINKAKQHIVSCNVKYKGTVASISERAHRPLANGACRYYLRFGRLIN